MTNEDKFYLQSDLSRTCAIVKRLYSTKRLRCNSNRSKRQNIPYSSPLTKSIIFSLLNLMNRSLWRLAVQSLIPCPLVRKLFYLELRRDADVLNSSSSSLNLALVTKEIDFIRIRIRFCWFLPLHYPAKRKKKRRESNWITILTISNRKNIPWEESKQCRCTTFAVRLVSILHFILRSKLSNWIDHKN